MIVVECQLNNISAIFTMGAVMVMSCKTANTDVIKLGIDDTRGSPA
jgi:hypothetical protein